MIFFSDIDPTVSMTLASHPFLGGFNTRTSPEEENENNKFVIQKALKRAFAPEFLNRVDDVVMFGNKPMLRSQVEIITNRTNEATKLKGCKLMSDYDIFVDLMGYPPEEARRKVAQMKIQKLQDLKLQILMQNPSLLG